MAEAIYLEIPKTVFSKTIDLKMSIGEAKAVQQALIDLPTPNARQIAVRDALAAALASAPDEP